MVIRSDQARQPGQTLTRFAWLSVAGAALTIGLKAGAYYLTGSVGVLSDALESLVNLVAAISVLVALAVAARPPDEEHPYGYEKVEYFSSGFEGALILVAALSIGVAAVGRLADPQPITAVGLGLAATGAAAVINLGIARVLLDASRRYGSIILHADAQHLLSDVWTSAGVIGGVGAVALTGWWWLDPVIALVMAVNIVRTGAQLVRRSTAGLLDAALPPPERAAVQAVLDRYGEEFASAGLEFHALRTRQSGTRRFLTVHVLVPGAWSVQRGHDILERIEADLRRALPGLTTATHLEPLEDPRSFADARIDRVEPEDTGRGADAVRGADTGHGEDTGRGEGTGRGAEAYSSPAKAGASGARAGGGRPREALEDEEVQS
jgi:cation diffusion facilitator family transporter